MEYENLINQNNIRLNSTSINKNDILKEIADIVVNNPAIKKYNANDIYKSLKEREDVCSTGFENEIAIPHCSLENIDNFMIGVLTKPEGLDFNAIDGKKTRLFFFMIGPKNKRNEHIQILSSISKLMKTKGVKEKIINAKDCSTIEWIIKEELKCKTKITSHKKKCLFYVIIQNQDYFNDILEILSSSVKGSITIIEGYNAAYFLNKLPLFSCHISLLLYV